MEKEKYIKWWQKILLWFLPTRYTLDKDEQGNYCELKIKCWGDINYIVGKRYYKK